MTHLLFSFASGVALIILVSLALYRWSPLSVTQNTVVVALGSVGVYLPIALLYWPGGDVLAIHVAIYLITCYACGVFLGVWQKAEGKHPSRRLHWGPALIAGFFVVLAAVDGVFIFLAEQGLPPPLNSLLPNSKTKATSAFPGVISHDFQQKENLYNDYLAQLKRQEERGWQVRKGWLGKPVAGEPAVLKVVAQTQEGEPLQGADVTGQFLRPSDSRLDIAFTMREVEPGSYEASLNLPLPGAWDLILKVRKNSDLHEIRAATSVSSP